MAIDPKKGAIVSERVLDHEEIASTKELVALRINAAGDRLICANGSDESVTILTLPELHIVREIGLEGESIADAIPDPNGRYLYVLGRKVHVYDAAGEKEIRTLDDVDPMAIAVSSDGSFLAVIARETFSSGTADVAALYETNTFKQLSRDPIETDRPIVSAIFAAGDRALLIAAKDWLAEKDLIPHPAKSLAQTQGTLKMTFDFGDLLSSETACLPDQVGPSILAVGTDPKIVYYAEKRCSAGGAFTAAPRKVKGASIYGVNAHSVAFDAAKGALVVTEPAGYLTIYKAPVPPPSK